MTFPGDRHFVGLKPPAFVEALSSAENVALTTPDGYNRASLVLPSSDDDNTTTGARSHTTGIWEIKVTVPTQWTTEQYAARLEKGHGASTTATIPASKL
jgi:hypothetical protein